MQSTRLFLLAILSVALGGCFVSSDALITPASADHPWGNLRAQEFGWEDGAWKPKGSVVLRREGPFYRVEVESSRDVTRLLVKRIGDNAYIAQMQDMRGSGNSAYMYGLLVVDGKRIYQYGFDDLSKRCQIPGIDAVSLKLDPYEEDCGVPSLATLTQVLVSLERSQPKYELKYEIEP